MPESYGSLREKIAAEKAERLARYQRFEEVWERAHEAGKAANEALTPTPMVVAEGDLITGRPIPGGKSWYVADGACGFGWVKVYPAGCSFAKWAKKTGKVRADRGAEYGGGLTVLWCPVPETQSIERHDAYCRAFARVLQEAGIQASAGSRLD